MRETININTRQCNKYYNRSNHRMLRKHRLKTLLEYYHKCILLKLTWITVQKHFSGTPETGQYYTIGARWPSKRPFKSTYVLV